MSIDEGARFELHQRLAEVLEEEATVTLMSQLPPPASDLATREQVDNLERRMDDRFDRVDERFERIETHLNRMLLAFVAITLSAVLVAAGVVLAATGVG